MNKKQDWPIGAIVFWRTARYGRIPARIVQWEGEQALVEYDDKGRIKHTWSDRDKLSEIPVPEDMDEAA